LRIISLRSSTDWGQIMLRSTLLALAFGAASLTLSACGDNSAASGANTENLAEKTNSNTYVAKKYGITATAPDGWFVMDSDVTKKLMDIGRDSATANADAKTKAEFDASIARSENIFGFLETDPKVSSEGGAGILGLAEDLAGAPDVKTGRDYFPHLRAAFEQTAANVTVDDNYTSVQIDGQTFDRMNIVMHGTSPTGASIQVNQRYLAARHDNSMIVFIQSYMDDADLAALDGIVSSIKLDWK